MTLPSEGWRKMSRILGAGRYVRKNDVKLFLDKLAKLRGVIRHPRGAERNRADNDRWPSKMKST